MIGYDRSDYGMTDWYNSEDRRQQQEKYECELVRLYKDDCRNMAASIACEFRWANGDTTDAEYLSDTDNQDWHDWLLCEAAEQGRRDWSDNDLHSAMLIILQQEIEDFTDCAWVLTQFQKQQQAA